MNRFLLASAVSALLVLPAHAGNLGSDEIQKNIVGKRISFTTVKGVKGTVRYSKSGKAKVKIKAKKFTDEGEWWIKGNSLCAKYSRISDGKTVCNTYTSVNAKTYKTNTGTVLKVGF